MSVLGLVFSGVMMTAPGYVKDQPPAPPKPINHVLGPFGLLGAATRQTEVPKAPIARLINSGLALTTDGFWLRWREQWNGAEIVGVEQFDRAGAEADLQGWNVPTTTSLVALPAGLKGESGCRLISAVIANGRRLGAWNCESANGTLLAAPAKSGEVVVLARLGYRFQGMIAGPMPHVDVGRITLAAYDPCTLRFEILELSWPQRQ
ncbi:hypothetical protein [Caulobacter sp. DWR1-3-2b1]|uniref:hypothetical protein n=1 Tax=Caulobacter sp. DWR1-3-2b1 TaxID=2804670 RepID=UPI003CF78BD4